MEDLQIKANWSVVLCNGPEFHPEEDNMKAAILSIILLGSLATATSQGFFHHCSCVQLSKSVRRFLISTVTEHPISVHCDHIEVIVRLKDGKALCLDPKSNFTKMVLLASKQRANATRTSQTP
ncbi:C-X-C motif chemokine 11-1-like [Genypterus blacodes]|uniref:C-X-C motif chemokine 11-1-like n=1 Tax=Genypterus blacodes TaxID=154954 RepID=UPI003F769225